MIKTEENILSRVSQGDIYKDIQYFECVNPIDIDKDSTIEMSIVVFPYVIVLTQDCDLVRDSELKGKMTGQDKLLLSVLVAPLYNAAHLIEGSHLSQLGLNASPIHKNSPEGKFLKDNRLPRYYYLEFPEANHLIDLVIDFKHYFSVHVKHLQDVMSKKFVRRISPLFREDISQRFANYLSRIGLPIVK